MDWNNLPTVSAVDNAAFAVRISPRVPETVSAVNRLSKVPRCNDCCGVDESLSVTALLTVKCRDAIRALASDSNRFCVTNPFFKLGPLATADNVSTVVNTSVGPPTL